MKKATLHQQLSLIVDELVTSGITLDQARKEFERQFIVAALRTNEGSLTRSAASLGVHRNTLRNKVGALGIKGRDYAPKRTRRRRTGAARSS